MARPRKTTDTDTTVLSPTEQPVRETATEINDSDDVVMVSLIPNVSYKDNKNGDYYRWDEIGHEELMPFSSVKDMYRNFRGYFENLWIRPKDVNVAKKLNLERLYKKYDYLIDIKNYTKENIDEICKEIESMNARNSNLKFTLFSRIIAAVENGEIVDFFVIRTLSRKFNLDLMK